MDNIYQFLQSQSDERWVANALNNIELLLIDHAHCEKKAASSALNMIYRYSYRPELLHKMSRLAREELRHFEQVLAIIEKRGIEFRPLEAGDYAKALHQQIRNQEPERLVDSLIIGAIIEARSCERFACLAPHLDDELGRFYHRLLASEARHFQDYLDLAKLYSDEDISERVAFFVNYEAILLQQESDIFRFHSGALKESAVA